MIRMGSYMWLVGTSIGLLSFAYISGESEERIREVTVRSLKFLTTYQANVAAHQASSLDEEQREDFLEKWKGNFFTPEDASKIYNLVVKDWRYSLDLASSNEDNFSALVIALYTKMEAYVQSLYYMPPRFMMSFYPERYDSEHCENLAVKLLILSYTGTDQLIKKLLSVAGSSLSADNLRDIKEYQTLFAFYYDDYRFSLRDKHHSVPDKKETSEGSFDEYVSVLENDPLLEVIKRLFSRMMFGDASVIIEEDLQIPYWSDADYWNFMWEKAKDINKRLAELPEGDNNYNITSALHDIISQRSEFGELSQQDFANELKEMNLKNLEIRVIQGEFSVNLN